MAASRSVLNLVFLDFLLTDFFDAAFLATVGFD